MLSGISLTCFTASYLVTFALEVSRLFFRVPVRLIVMVIFTILGLFTHSVYLVRQAQEAAQEAAAAPFSGWYEWCLIAAWVLAAVYLSLSIRRPQSSSGLFVLPLVLVFIVAAYFARDVAPFPRNQALLVWQIVHGTVLLIGTIVVMLGFAAGIMYLVQAYRLPAAPSLQGIAARIVPRQIHR